MAVCFGKTPFPLELLRKILHIGTEAVNSPAHEKPDEYRGLPVRLTAA
jgi:hypothetical protein